VKILDKIWRLPVTKQAKVEVIRSVNLLEPWLVYKYKYSNHKAFTANTKIRYGAIGEPSDEEPPETD
jgi:hypothetical protein